MSNPPSPSEQEPVSPEVTEQLRRQAEALRETARPQYRSPAAASPARKFALLALIGITVGGSLFLLLMSGTRRQLIERVSQEWTRLYQSDRQAGIHKLPAPPPRLREARVIGAVPVIVDSSITQIIDPTVEEEERPVFAPPPKNAQAETAFRLLTEKSAAARRLVQGSVAGVQYQDWRPLQFRPPVFVVDLVASASGREAHYVWSVNLEDGETRAQSQLARDLEASSR